MQHRFKQPVYLINDAASAGLRFDQIQRVVGDARHEFISATAHQQWQHANQHLAQVGGRIGGGDPHCRGAPLGVERRIERHPAHIALVGNAAPRHDFLGDNHAPSPQRYIRPPAIQRTLGLLFAHCYAGAAFGHGAPAALDAHRDAAVVVPADHAPAAHHRARKQAPLAMQRVNIRQHCAFFVVNRYGRVAGGGRMQRVVGVAVGVGQRHGLPGFGAGQLRQDTAFLQPLDQ